MIFAITHTIWLHILIMCPEHSIGVQKKIQYDAKFLMEKY